MELLRVLDLEYADSVGQSRELLERDLLSDRVRVADVEAGVDLAIGELAVDHGETNGKASAHAIGSRLEIRLVHHHVVPSCRDRIQLAGIRLDLGCVETEVCHY